MFGRKRWRRTTTGSISRKISGGESAKKSAIKFLGKID